MVEVLNICQELAKDLHSEMFIQMFLIVHFCNKWDTVTMFEMLSRYSDWSYMTWQICHVEKEI